MLIEHIKYLYSKNLTSKNIQTSPEFTHLHEYVLTYKWGLELDEISYIIPFLKKRTFNKFSNTE